MWRRSSEPTGEEQNITILYALHPPIPSAIPAHRYEHIPILPPLITKIVGLDNAINIIGAVSKPPLSSFFELAPYEP